MQSTLRKAPRKHLHTVSVLAETLATRNISMREAAQRSGMPLDDVRRLCTGHVSAIELSTLAALCSSLDCRIEDVLNVQCGSEDSRTRFCWLRQAASFQSSWLTVVALIISSIISVCFLAGLVSRVNPVDFFVYHYASASAIAGDNIYAGNIHGPGMPAGGLPFTYTPFASLLFLPLNLLPAKTAYLLWSIASSLVMGMVLRRLLPLEHRNRPLANGLIGLIASCTIVMASHIIFGQVNVFLMALVLLDVGRTSENRLLARIPNGVLAGIAAAVKLTPALFIVYFIVTRQKPAALASSLAAVVATILAGLVYPGMTIDFAGRVLWNLSDRVSLDGFFATSGNNSVQGALAAAGSWTAMPATALTLAVAVFGLYAAATIFRRGGRIQAAVVVGITACMVSPVSWMHHWVYLLPGLLLLWVHGGRKTAKFCLASLVVLLATGPNLGDILLGSGEPLLIPLALVFRESLLLMGFAIVFLLLRQADPPAARDARGRRASRLRTMAANTCRQGPRNGREC